MLTLLIKFSSINLYYQNVRGLRTKTHEFLSSLASSSADIIILTETWLNDSVNSSELFDDRYNVYRRDRVVNKLSKKKDGGGVLIAVTKKLCSKHINNWQSECEDLWVVVNIPTDKKYQ